MARGPKKHLKRLAAPKHWMLDKLSGVWAPRPSSGPHKRTECLPLILMLRNRLKYALTGKEVTSILMQRLVKVDGKVRTDPKYPAGLMDVITIEKTNENFRLVYDAKGRFKVHAISDVESTFKLCKIRSLKTSQKGIPVVTTHDGRTVRYPHPDIKVNDTVKFDIASSKILAHLKFEVGSTVMITGGRNIGRVGHITHHEKHNGGFDIVHIRDANEHTFATRLNNVFVIGSEKKLWISLNVDSGVRLSIAEERDKRLANRK